MRDVRVVDITDAIIVVVDADGEEFRVTLDDAQIAKLRSPRNDGAVVKVSPKEIQSLIRAGLSAEEVARVSGATLEDIDRYEGPVLAEREYVLTSALSTLTNLDDDYEQVPFGTHVRARLESLGAQEQRWVAWKDPADGWLIKVEFTSKNIEHDARWSFDARRSSLIPVNADAVTLSQRGDVDSGMVPRLRAVDVMTGAIPTINDSGAHPRRIPTSPVFSQVSESIRTGAINIIPTPAPTLSPAPDEPAVVTPATNADEVITEALGVAPTESFVGNPLSGIPVDATDDDRATTPTADLLEALRKRRTQRDDTPSWLTDARVQPTAVPEATIPNPISEDVLNAVAIEIPETTAEFSIGDLPADENSGPIDAEPLTETGKQRRARKTRPTLPAWDNIVYNKPAEDIG